MQGGSKLPPSETPLLVRDIGGASGASLRAWARRPWSREDGLTRTGEAHSYPRRPFRPSVLAREGQGGGCKPQTGRWAPPARLSPPTPTLLRGGGREDARARQ